MERREQDREGGADGSDSSPNPHRSHGGEDQVRRGLIAEVRARIRRMEMESELLAGAEPPPFTPEQLESLSTEQLLQLRPGMTRDEVVDGLAVEPELADPVAAARSRLPAYLQNSPEKRERMRNLLTILTQWRESLPPDQRAEETRRLMEAIKAALQRQRQSGN